MHTTTPRFSLPFGPQTAMAAAGVLSLLLLSSLVVGKIGAAWLPGATALLTLSAITAIGLALLRLPRVSRIAQVFLAGAFLATLIVAVALPKALPAMQAALMQGTAFSAFLTALGLIRAPVRRSTLIARAAEGLFAHSARARVFAVSLGAQGISVLFNIGTIGMIADIARNHDAARKAAGKRGIDTRAMTLAALRGTLLMTVWSPIGLGFAIVTSAIPTLDPVLFFGLAFAIVALISVVAAVLDAAATAVPTGPRPHDPAPEGAGRALTLVLAAIAGLIALTIAAHRLLDVSFLIAACLVLPLLAALWPRLEPGLRSTGSEGALTRLSAASEGMATESTIFLAAAVIGAAVAAAAQAAGIDALIAGGQLPALAVILACLVLIPAVGAVMIPHTIVMIMAAQLFGAGPVGADHPYALGLALLFAWALAIAASPISAMSIITGRELGVTPQRVTFALNLRFTLGLMAAAALVVGLVYVLD
ncbi:hypothetical protein ACTTAI_12770 [Rhodobacter capsulatus]|uniref:hypothetical protein n=1 Tax=Rhodobacter capsulatus TaxID=1061 RepID=UPI004029C616